MCFQDFSQQENLADKVLSLSVVHNHKRGAQYSKEKLCHPRKLGDGICQIAGHLFAGRGGSCWERGLTIHIHTDSKNLRLISERLCKMLPILHYMSYYANGT